MKMRSNYCKEVISLVMHWRCLRRKGWHTEFEFTDPIWNSFGYGASSLCSHPLVHPLGGGVHNPAPKALVERIPPKGVGKDLSLTSSSAGEEGPYDPSGALPRALIGPGRFGRAPWRIEA